MHKKSVSTTLTALCYKGLFSLSRLIKDDDRSLNYLKKITAQGSVNEELWWEIGAIYGRNNKWDEALKAFLKALHLCVIYSKRNRAKYIFSVALAEERLGKKEMAEALYDETLRYNQNFGEVYLAKGQLLLDKELYKEALSCFQQYLKKNTADYNVLNSMGICYLAMNNLEEAQKFLGQANKLKGNHRTILKNLAALYIKKEEYSKAVTILEKINEGEDTQIWSELGFCYGNIGYYKKSIFYYQKAHTDQPQNKEYCLNLAASYAKAGIFADALKLYKNLLLEDPFDPDLLNDIGWVFECQELYDKAEEQYNRGLALAPNNPYIIYNLICCINKQGRYIEALNISQRLKDIKGWQKTYWSLLGQIFENVGDNRRSVYYYNKALGLD